MTKTRTTTFVLLAMSVIAIASLAPTAAATSCAWNDRPYSPVWIIETASGGLVDFRNGDPCYVNVAGQDVPPQ